MPGFKKTYLRYLSEVESLSFAFVGFVAEALGLAPDGLEQFYDAGGLMQHRSKVRNLVCARYMRGKWERGKGCVEGRRRGHHDHGLTGTGTVAGP